MSQLNGTTYHYHLIKFIQTDHLFGGMFVPASDRIKNMAAIRLEIFINEYDWMKYLLKIY